MQYISMCLMHSLVFNCLMMPVCWTVSCVHVMSCKWALSIGTLMLPTLGRSHSTCALSTCALYLRFYCNFLLFCMIFESHQRFYQHWGGGNTHSFFLLTYLWDSSKMLRWFVFFPPLFLNSHKHCKKTKQKTNLFWELPFPTGNTSGELLSPICPKISN